MRKKRPYKVACKDCGSVRSWETEDSKNVFLEIQKGYCSKCLEKNGIIRTCPDCGKKLKWNTRAVILNRPCGSCKQLGDKNHFKGKTHSKEHKEWLKTHGMNAPESKKKAQDGFRKFLEDPIRSKEYRENLSIKMLNQKQDPEFRFAEKEGHRKFLEDPNRKKKWQDKISEKIRWKYKYDEEYLKNHRVGRRKLKAITAKKLEGISHWVPQWNPRSIPIIEEYGKENGYNFQHAENGGEVRVLNYWVDAYDKEKNVVLEYYEKFHNKQKEHDEHRRKTIMKELNCKFIIIHEDGNVREYNNVNK